MMSEQGKLAAATKEWLANPWILPRVFQMPADSNLLESIGFEDQSRWRPTQSELNKLSVDIGQWLIDFRPDADLFRAVSARFDLVAQASWPIDRYGERYEICSALAFLAWRHASALGLAIESQAWLRISDLLSEEPSVEGISREASLFSEDEESKDAERLLLNNPLDVYVVLSLLRRERNRKHAAVLECAMRLYDRLTRRAPNGSSDGENAFFLGEFAFLAATIWRMTGNVRERRDWLTRAHSHFAQANSNEPLLLKIRLTEASEAFDFHRYEAVKNETADILLLLESFEMSRELLLCKLVSALALKMRGDNTNAGAKLAQLVSEWRNSSEKHCFSIAASSLAEIRSFENESTQAAELAAEALIAAREYGDRCAEAAAWTFISTLHRDEGNVEACISALITSKEIYEEVPSQRHAAYVRVVIAEVLIENRRWLEAVRELLGAVPVIRSENMIAEGVHALKLLSMLPREFATEKSALKNTLALIRSVES